MSNLPESHPLMSGSEVEHDLEKGADLLYNDRPPLVELLREKPEHRIIVMLKAQGLSNREIAEKMELSPVTIGYVLKQPWARQRLVNEIQESGRDAVTELLRGAVLDSVITLIEVRDGETSKPSERTSAANALLDRYYGKPVQRVETDNTHRMGKSLDEIDRELEALEQEEAQLTGARRN